MNMRTWHLTITHQKTCCCKRCQTTTNQISIFFFYSFRFFRTRKCFIISITIINSFAVFFVFSSLRITIIRFFYRFLFYFSFRFCLFIIFCCNSCSHSCCKCNSYCQTFFLTHINTTFLNASFCSLVYPAFHFSSIYKIRRMIKNLSFSLF